MYKLAIFHEHISNFTHLVNIKNIMRIVGEQNCILWDNTRQSNLEYLLKNKDNRLYRELFDYCEDNQIEYLHISYLVNPEFLLAELNFRQTLGKLKTKISFVTDWRLMEISEPRQLVFYELLEKVNIHKVIIFSSLGPQSSYYGKIRNKEINYHPKIRKMFVPVYLPDLIPVPNELPRLKYDIPEDKFVVLFFGAMYYGKGIDILLKAME
jgi:glycosyltransferase involved in cell wall biosynthesis